MVIHPRRNLYPMPAESCSIKGGNHKIVFYRQMRRQNLENLKPGLKREYHVARLGESLVLYGLDVREKVIAARVVPYVVND